MEALLLVYRIAVMVVLISLIWAFMAV